jgi:hypothetical protein
MIFARAHFVNVQFVVWHCKNDTSARSRFAVRKFELIAERLRVAARQIERSCFDVEIDLLCVVL